jgi:hypothetical protein
MGLLLWELVADPMCDRYEFSADVRHDDSSGGVSQVGLYFAYRSVDSITGTPLLRFISVDYADRGALVKQEEGSLVVRVFFVDADPARSQPFMFPAPVTQKPIPAVWPKGGPSPWRRLSLAVTPEEILATWKDAAGGKPIHLGVRTSQIENIITKMRLFPEIWRPIPHELSPRSGLGLFLLGAKASFRNVRLEPMTSSQ